MLKLESNRLQDYSLMLMLGVSIVIINLIKNLSLKEELLWNKNEMKRTLGFFPALTTVMGTVIGAGVFFKAGRVAELTGQ